MSSRIQLSLYIVKGIEPEVNASFSDSNNQYLELFSFSPQLLLSSRLLNVIMLW